MIRYACQDNDNIIAVDADADEIRLTGALENDWLVLSFADLARAFAMAGVSFTTWKRSHVPWPKETPILLALRAKDDGMTFACASWRDTGARWAWCNPGGDFALPFGADDVVAWMDLSDVQRGIARL